jgi:hypothetical protein
MPYSTDSDLNKENPATPSEFSLGSQLLYRVASLDSTVQQGFRRVDEGMDRLRSDFHEAQLATNDRINNLDKEMHETFALKRARIDGLVEKGNVSKAEIDKRLVELETWKAVAVAKISVLIGILFIAWTFLAPTLRNLLGIANG